MANSDSGRVTQLLADVRAGRHGATDELFGLVHTELRNVARRKWLNVPPGDTLQPTALVHEVYLRLTAKADRDWKNRVHFFAVAARAMHDIIVERARRHEAKKRKPPGQGTPDYEVSLSPETPPIDLSALKQSLSRLESHNKTSYDVAIVRIFCELTGDETAAALGVSTSTVDRKWKFAKAWLHRELSRISE
ncbi:MAG: RNA polymerase subunit sigma [Planctomycetes bacterium]|nr:RNA polymerase subunit sigma [Planctomycetota bacterium]